MVNQKISAIIIDDEIQAQSALKVSLSIFCPEIEVKDVASSVSEAIDLINNNHYSIIFLDIKLTDGNGFDILESIYNKNQRVIFTTAYSEYALEAIKHSALDYLQKPISGKELRIAIDKVLKLEAETNQLLLNNFINNQSYGFKNRKIAIHSSEGVTICSVDTLLYCQAEGNYVKLYFSDRKTLLISKTLKELEELIASFGFERIHHSYLVNLDHLTNYYSKDGGYVKLSNGSELPVSKRKRSSLLSTLNMLMGDK